MKGFIALACIVGALFAFTSYQTGETLLDTTPRQVIKEATKTTHHYYVRVQP